MLINNLFENEPLAYYNEKADNSIQRMSDLRKTRLTLAQIKRLRMMNDLKKFEEQNKIRTLSKQYKPAGQPGLTPTV